MAVPGIAIEAAPPVWAPLRFLLTAPWFGVLAGLLLLWSGPSALASRWTPELLAAAHLLTLGFMSMAMFGTLLQLMPVVAGAPLPRTVVLAGVLHALLTAGTLLLAAGLWRGSAFVLRAAVPLLAVGLGLFVVVALLALLRARVREAVGRNIALALTALGMTVVFGTTLAAALGWSVPLAVGPIVELHAAWGLVGWTLVLVAAIAQHVVPMIQATPLYPSRLGAWFGTLVLLLLSAWSAAVWLDVRTLQSVLGAGIAGAALAFAAITLVLQARSRRAPDATARAWRFAMLCLALAAVLGVAEGYGDDTGGLPILTGMLAIAGCALSVISGMLYKIVPFLVWLHLRNTVGGRVPNIKLILPDALVRRHLAAHLAAVALLCAAVLWRGWLIYPAAMAFALSNALLGWLLLRACRWAAWRPERAY